MRDESVFNDRGAAGPRLLRALLAVGAFTGLVVAAFLQLTASAQAPDQQPASDYVIELHGSRLDTSAAVSVAGVASASGEPGQQHFVIQFEQLPADEVQLAAAGIELLTYVGGNAYTASAPLSAASVADRISGVRWAGPLPVALKVDPAVLAVDNDTAWMMEPDGRVRVTVTGHADVDAANLAAAIERLGGETLGQWGDHPTFTVATERDTIEAIAALDIVAAVTLPGAEAQTFNDVAAEAVGADVVAEAPYNLTGAGVQAMVYELNLVDIANVDFAGRIGAIDQAELKPDADGDGERDETFHTHPTHVAGTIGGSGANSSAQGGTPNQWAGLAPRVTLETFGQSAAFAAWEADMVTDAQLASTRGTDVINMSFGYAWFLACTFGGNYWTAANALDQVVNDDPSLTIVKAAGNSASPCGRIYDTLDPMSTAKNVIVVGSIDNAVGSTNVSAYSSTGPTTDGRIKPDVVAPGCLVTSTDFDDTNRNGFLDGGEARNRYGGKCGTSMAAPVTTGTVALLLEQLDGVLPADRITAHLMRALMIHSADDIGTVGPDYLHGWGRINVATAADLIAAHAADEATLRFGDVRANQQTTFTVTSDGTEPMRATLAYTDPLSAPGAAAQLVNDLDLEVVDPSGRVWSAFVLNPAVPAAAATTGRNTLDNVEQVVAPAQAGSWTIRVSGTSVPSGPQDFALIVPPSAGGVVEPPCVINNTPVATVASKAECDALVAFSQAANVGSWANSAGWGTATDPCGWFGVTCRPEGVVEVNLIGNNLSGTISPAIGDLRNLVALRLSDNNLSGAIPTELGNLADLRDLWIIRNQLSGPIPAELGNLSRLSTLILWGNSLSGPIPAEIGNLTALVSLSLGLNSLSGPIPSELGNLARLQTLYLSGNDLTGSIPPALGNLERVRWFSLDGNALSGSIPSELANLSDVRLLNLRANLLRGDLTTAIAGMSDTLTDVWLADGGGANDCLTSSSATVTAFLDARNPGWDTCESPGATPTPLPTPDRPTPEQPCRIANTIIDTVASRAECDALLALHTSTGGAGWTNSTGWATASDPCGWYGVSCNADGVNRVNLANNDLDGRIPRQFGDLGNLSFLDLSYNSIDGFIPASLADLANLEHLALIGNDLVGNIPEALADIDGLEILLLSNNSLTGAIPVELGNLSSLRVLWLSDNQLVGSIPPELGSLTGLEQLILATNQLTGPIPRELGNLKNLDTLWLARNSLSGSIPPELGGLDSLDRLYLQSNRLTGDLTAAIEGTRDTLRLVTVSDGRGSNDCLSSSSTAVVNFLDAKDPGWNDCG